ncbi:RNB domain-containing ribonuclease [Nocardioides yefusunii]|uniref:RNB domain-containing ribonuclease n=1 Tax=Nocardioides yefusunii TaxID=2500546 RepID=A0ABW1QW02_9ACTN|nr:RNB domain-containing ribonuclease [Nocardioides yefusunii]
MTSPRLVRHGSLPTAAPEATGFPGEQQLRDGIAALRTELEVVEEFPAEVEETAARAAASPRLPELDRTDLEFVTIDPDGARDLDQAVHIARRSGEEADDGFVVHYAIADLGAFITPGDAVDVEANRRGQTLYGADSKIPLHPKVISEDAGSLLPDQVRPAALWTIELDAAGAVTTFRVERALVRSRAQLSYGQVQTALDADTLDALPSGAETVRLLREVGPLRLAAEAARGGVSLPLPEQEIVTGPQGWELVFRSMTPVEEWNAQISLLTGICAATTMVQARVGIVRTLPPAQDRDVQRLRRTAAGLGVAWDAGVSYPEFVRSLDPTIPSHAAVVLACTRLFRGSGYAAFTGGLPDGEMPEVVEHAAVASVYAHVTAPLRRLVDRYGTEVCLALHAGEPVPAWVLERLPELPATMRSTGSLAGKYERGVLDLTEAVVLQDRVGETFDAVVTEVEDDRPGRGDVTVAVPAVEARVRSEGDLPLGQKVRVQLAEADPVTRKVSFTHAP